MMQKMQDTSGYNIFKSSLGKQFFLKLFFFSLLISVLTTALNLYVEGRKEIKDLNQEIRKFEYATLKPIIEACWVSNTAMLKLQIEGLAKDPYIRFVRLELGDQSEITAGNPEGDYNVSKKIPLSYSFLNKNVTLGCLVVHFSVPDYSEPYWVKFINLFFVQSVTVFWVSAFIFYLFYMLIGRHLYDIAQYTQNITPETIGSPLNLKTSKYGTRNKDELSMVVSAINLMLRPRNFSPFRASFFGHFSKW